MLFAQNAQIVTHRYRGPDRRRADNDYPDEEISCQIMSDTKGNPVLDVRTNAPRRRKGDDTLDLIKRLDADAPGFDTREH